MTTILSFFSQLMKNRYEIYPGSKEVFTNNKYKSIASIAHAVKAIEGQLGELLSVRLYKYEKVENIPQYNIETKNSITNITTHNGLDLHLVQYDKKNKERKLISPYSNPGYSIFAHLLCAYFEVFQKRPAIHFGEMDIKGWKGNRNGRDNPIINYVDGIRFDGSMFWYLFHPEDFNTDTQGIQRIMAAREPGKWQEDGFGIQGNNVILHNIDYFYKKGNVTDMYFEKELLPLFLQAIIDVNRAVAGPTNSVNMKKIYEMIYYILENEDIRKRGKDNTGVFTEARKNTLI